MWHRDKTGCAPAHPPARISARHGRKRPPAARDARWGFRAVPRRKSRPWLPAPRPHIGYGRFRGGHRPARHRLSAPARRSGSPGPRLRKSRAVRTALSSKGFGNGDVHSCSLACSLPLPGSQPYRTGRALFTLRLTVPEIGKTGDDDKGRRQTIPRYRILQVIVGQIYQRHAALWPAAGFGASSASTNRLTSLLGGISVLDAMAARSFQ